MSAIWVIRHNEPSIDVVTDRYVSIGWDEVGDLTHLGRDRGLLKQSLAAAYPEAKQGAIPVWAGIIYRFVNEVSVGDVVISPNPVQRTLSFGVVEGDYFYEASGQVQRNRRPVRWLHTDVPRDTFSKAALFEIGSVLTLFAVTRHAAEFQAFLDGRPQQSVPTDSLSIEESGLPSAQQVESASRDFVVEVLRKMDAYKFEELVAGLLRAMGFYAQATVSSGDGGIDVIATKDRLGVEAPIIKVQCKRMTSTIGAPDVQNLIGSLAHGGSDVGVFVTLGGYSADAQKLERSRHGLRLLSGNQFVDLLFEHYESLDSEWKRLLPLRRVYAVASDS